MLFALKAAGAQLRAIQFPLPATTPVLLDTPPLLFVSSSPAYRMPNLVLPVHFQWMVDEPSSAPFPGFLAAQWFAWRRSLGV